MSKRKKKSQNKQSNFLKYTAYILATVALVLSSLVGGYFLGYEDGKNDSKYEQKKQKQKELSSLEKVDKLDKNHSRSVNSRLKDVLKKESKFQSINKSKEALKKEVLKVKEYANAAHEYENNALAKPPKRVKKDIKYTKTDRPKLAIIIDDVSTKSHVNAIKSLRLPITMSFLPPSKSRPNSAKLASKESFYMVHLPMEAKSYSAEEPITLRVSNSQQEIFNRIKKIRSEFPKVRYINNHTGSKFTADKVAMNRLITVLNKYHIRFIDSRTTAETKAPEVLESFGLKYVARDVFLDHHSDKAYIISQIKKAIKIAKTEGSAIAIGHPHANTIMALYESKKLFKDVELVYVNKVY